MSKDFRETKKGADLCERVQAFFDLKEYFEEQNVTPDQEHIKCIKISSKFKPFFDRRQSLCEPAEFFLKFKELKFSHMPMAKWSYVEESAHEGSEVGDWDSR